MLRSVTGIALTNTIDMTCSKYQYTGEASLMHVCEVCFWWSQLKAATSSLKACTVTSLVDVLLCHDDQLEGRRIAFIYYLVPEWSKEDGGYNSCSHFPVGSEGLLLLMHVVGHRA